VRTFSGFNGTHSVPYLAGFAMPIPACLGSVTGRIMNIKTKNILTALVLISIAVAIYVLAVIKAVSQ